MYVVQLAVEGVSALPERTRLAFRGHLDVVRLSSREARSALLDVFFHTLFPDPDRADATAELVRPGAERTRALLTLAGRDKIPYRIMRDLASGRCRLYRFDQRSRHHEVLTDTAREAQQFLRVQHQLPDDASYERLFMLCPDTRPSAGGEAKSRAGALRTGFGAVAPSGPGLAGPGSLPPPSLPDPQGELTSMFPLPAVLAESTGAHPAPSGFSMHNALVKEELEVSGTLDLVSSSSTEDLETRRKALTKALRRARRAEKLEGALEKLAEKEEAAQAAVRTLEALEAERDEIDAHVESERAELGSADELGRRIDRFERLDAHYRAEREALQRELDDREAGLGAAPRRRWYLDPGLVGGGVAAGLCAGLAVGLGEPTPLLGQVLFGSLGGWAGLRALGRDVAYRERKETLERVRERLAATEREHHVETATVRGTMTRLGIEEVAELRARQEHFAGLEQRLAALERRLEGPDGRRGERGREVLRRVAVRRAELEDELRRADDGTGTSVAALERQLKALDGELQGRTGDIAPAGDASDGSLDLAFEEDEEDPVGPGGRSGSGGYRAAAGASGGWLAAPAGFGSGPGGGSGAAYGGGGGEDPRAVRVRALVEAASDLSGMPQETFVAEAAPRVGRYVQALTGQRFTGAQLDDRGRLSLLEGGGGRTLAESLDGAALDQVDAGLRFGLLESVLRLRRVPVLIEEPFASLPPERRRVVQQIYAHLAKLTQLIVVTPADDLDGNPIVPG